MNSIFYKELKILLSNNLLISYIDDDIKILIKITSILLYYIMIRKYKILLLIILLLWNDYYNS